MANATLTGVFLATQRHPDFNRLLKVETLKARYEHSKINGLDIDRTVQRLMYIMNEEKAFADEELSLSQLADELDIRPQQLSQILNEKLNKNFSGFVNEFRIEEAKKMLLEEPKRSILSIGIAVGFNSATSFNLAFSRYEGCSPGTYRKKYLKQPIKP
jgi:AraC-like DNA-binding protein